MKKFDRQEHTSLIVDNVSDREKSSIALTAPPSDHQCDQFNKTFSPSPDV